MKVFYYFTLILFFVTSCKKEKTTTPGNPSTVNNSEMGYMHINGNVLDSLTGNPLSGIIIGPFEFIGMQLYDTSNVDGHYSQQISWPLDYGHASNFMIQTKENQPYYYNESFYIAPYGDGDNVVHHINAVPYCQLSVHITGITNGEILEIRDFKTNGVDLINLGTTFDTVITRPVYSNRTTTIDLYVNGTIYTSIPNLTQYGSVETIDIQYP